MPDCIAATTSFPTKQVAITPYQLYVLENSCSSLQHAFPGPPLHPQTDSTFPESGYWRHLLIVLFFSLSNFIFWNTEILWKSERILRISICSSPIFTTGPPRGAKEPACQSKRHKRHGFDTWVRKIPWKREWQPTPVFLPENSMDRGATAHWVTKNPTQLKRLSTHHGKHFATFAFSFNKQISVS